MSERKLIVVLGPTASGKTAYAIQLANQFQCPIISSDSRQVFKELSIGVARPDDNELNAAPHYLIASHSIHDVFNAGIYAKEARALVNHLFETNTHLIVCGGTGLYVKALLEGFDPLPPKNANLRHELQMQFESDGISFLQKKLQSLSEKLYGETEIQNPQRLIRAIEIASSPGIAENDIPSFIHSFHVEFHYLNLERHLLYERINLRVDRMLEMGLENEAKSLLEFQNLNALQTVGYSEWWPYFNGETTIKETIDKIKQHSRNYAKRQETWFKHQIPKLQERITQTSDFISI